MNAFLSSLRADLLDRRVRVVLIVLLAALVAGLVYALTGGSGSAPAPPSSFPPISAPAPGIAAVAATPSPKLAVAETTSGASKQRGGPVRDPFAPLPGAATATASTSSSSSSSATKSTTSVSSTSTTTTTSTKTGSSSSGSSSGGHAAAPQPAPVKQQVVIHFHTTVQFGVVPAAPAPGAQPPAPQLKTHKDIKVGGALPSKDNSQLVYLGVVLHTGKAAVFELTGEAILHGPAKCLPSPTHCQAIELGIGQSETLESIQANGTPVTYAIKLLSISRSATSGSAAGVHVASVG